MSRTGCVLLLLAACRGGASSDRATGDSTAATASGELNRCALVTDAEIEAAIGPHSPGRSSLENEWGIKSCQWTATQVYPMEGYPDGWRDVIEVAVFDADVVPMIRQQVRGDPVSGVVAGATYDNTHGELWFDCPGGRLCVVKARTRSGDRRGEITAELARLVTSRVR
jgi:hypothetical protein